MELLMVTFSSEKQKYDGMKLKFATMVEDMSHDEWSRFSLKIEMLVEELIAFSKCNGEFATLNQALVKNIRKKDSIQKELDKVIQSDKKIFGMLTKITKEDHVVSLRHKISRYDEKIKIDQKLVVLGLQVILNIEIPMIKKRKQERLHTIITEFARERVIKLHNELAFWDQVLDTSEQNGNFESEMLLSKIMEKTQLETENKKP